MTEALLTMPPEGTPILVRAGKRISSLARRATAVATAAALLVGSWPVHAQQGGPPLLRDAETEQLLRDYTRPILRAAGLEKQNIQVVIINDSTFNAFVADGRRIFVNYGALRESETPNQIIGVLAHETGHLAGGHLAKLREQVSHDLDWLMVLCLRVASILHRRREAQDLPLPALFLKRRRLRLEVPRNWARSHPLTDETLASEAAAWNELGVFEDVGYERI